MRLGCLFVLVPLFEMALLIWVGGRIGLLPTLGIVVATGLLGAYLLRREGGRVLASARADLAAGRAPAQSVMVGVAVVIGGAFLLTPGVLTDIVGLLLLLPPTRAWILKKIRARVERMVAAGQLRAVTFGTKGFGGGGPDEHSASTDPHGRPGGIPFQFDEPGDDPPPRPGEIIQD